MGLYAQSRLRSIPGFIKRLLKYRSTSPVTDRRVSLLPRNLPRDHVAPDEFLIRRLARGNRRRSHWNNRAFLIIASLELIRQLFPPLNRPPLRETFSALPLLRPDESISVWPITRSQIYDNHSRDLAQGVEPRLSPRDFSPSRLWLQRKRRITQTGGRDTLVPSTSNVNEVCNTGER